MNERARLWTLDELCAEVARALAVGYDGQPSGRVREVPDRRTVRYYTTLGLLDRPAAMRGRTALYGPRHLLQLVAIKRLQAQGLALAEVQTRLVGQPDTVLARLAGVDKEEGERKNQPSRTDFWKDEPAPAPPVLVGVPLAEGVTLLLQVGRPVEEYDLEVLRAAAGPLLRVLQARHLVGGTRTDDGQAKEGHHG